MGWFCEVAYSPAPNQEIHRSGYSRETRQNDNRSAEAQRHAGVEAG